MGKKKKREKEKTLVDSIKTTKEKEIEKIEVIKEEKNEKEKEKNKELDSIKTKKNEIEKEEQSYTNKEKETLKNIKKLERDIKEKEDKIKSMDMKLNGKIKELKNLGTEFKYNSKEESSLANLIPQDKNKDNKKEYKFPEEQINSVGDLYENNKKRYLQIKYYEQLREAKKEAERLNAVVCVKGD